MKKDMREIIAYGICTFGADIDRDSNGYGHLIPTQPTEACSVTCDYCWHCAEHILKTIEEAEKWEPTTKSKP
jgi:hypothetical protein